MRPVYNTCVNSVVDNGTRTYEFLATEEELVASQYELSEVEALLLHLNDKKQLLLERIGRLNDAILLKHNRHHVHQYGASTVNPIIHANRAESSRTNGRTWSEVVSGNPKQLLLDRLSTNTNNSSHDPEHISRKLPHKLHNPIRKPMEILGTSNYPPIVHGQIFESKSNKVNTKRTKTVDKGDNKSPSSVAHKVLIIGDSHMRNCATNVKSTIKNNFAVQGVVKPGAMANILVNAAKNEVKRLSKKDFVVICRGANDIGKNNSAMALQQIMDFVATNTHTNIAVITAPPRHNLMPSSCINSAVTTFNRKLKKLIKAHHHAS